MALWTPLNLGSKLLDWWNPRADASFTYGPPAYNNSSVNSVQSWASQATGGRLLTSSGGTNYPNIVRSTDSNGLAVVGFTYSTNNVGMYFDASAYPTGSTPAGVAAALNDKYKNGKFGIIGFGTYSTNTDAMRYLMPLSTRDSGMAQTGGLRNDNINNGAIANYHPYDLGPTVLIDVEGGPSAPSQMRINGTVAASVTRTINTVAASTGYVGSNFIYESFDGDMYDVVAWTGALTTDEMQRLEGFLAWNSGSQGNLPANHPYKAAAPTTGAAASTTPSSASQYQAATSPTVGARASVSPSSAAQPQVSTSPALAARSSASPDNSTQAHAASIPALSGVRSAVYPDADSQTQTATTPTLATRSTTAVDGASHQQTAAMPTISAGGIVGVSSAAQSQATTSPAISVQGAAVPTSASQAQSATQATVSVRSTVDVNSASTSQAATQPTLTIHLTLLAYSAVQPQSASSPVMSVKVVITVATATQRQTATSPVLFVGRRPPPPANRTVTSVAFTRIVRTIRLSRVAA